MGAVGTLAPTVFLPPRNYTYKCTSFFCPAPKLYLYWHPCYLVQFGASEHTPETPKFVTPNMTFHKYFSNLTLLPASLRPINFLNEIPPP